MLAIVALCATALLPYQLPSANRGTSATPDYASIASRAAASVPVDSWINGVSVVQQRAESGLRKVRAAYKSAPDYASIAGSALASIASASVPSAELPSELVERAEGSIRKLRAAYKTSPDYAKISGAVAAAGVALAYTHSMDMHGIVHGHGLGAAVQQASPSTPFVQFKAAKEATPQYGAIAAAAALIGRARAEEDAMRSAGIGF